MAEHTVEFELGKRDGKGRLTGKLIVDGVDMSNLVTSVAIDAKAHKLPVVTLTMSPSVLRVKVAAEVVEVPHEWDTAAAEGG